MLEIPVDNFRQRENTDKFSVFILQHSQLQSIQHRQVEWTRPWPNRDEYYWGISFELQKKITKVRMGCVPDELQSKNPPNSRPKCQLLNKMLTKSSNHVPKYLRNTVSLITFLSFSQLLLILFSLILFNFFDLAVGWRRIVKWKIELVVGKRRNSNIKCEKNLNCLGN